MVRANPIREGHLNIRVKLKKADGIFVLGTCDSGTRLFFCSNYPSYNGADIHERPEGYMYSYAFTTEEKIEYEILDQTHEVW